MVWRAALIGPKLANMGSDKFCFKWNDFQENILSCFKELRSDKEFTDVTLACEDGQQIEAHKVVLTTCSPLFRNLLRSPIHQRPLIYMRRVKFENLVAMLDFAYCGQASVCQDDLDAFLTLSGELKLKGLTGEGKKEYNVEDQPVVKAETPFESKNQTVPPVSLQATKPDQLEEQIKSMMEPSGKFITRKGRRRQKIFLCIL